MKGRHSCLPWSIIAGAPARCLAALLCGALIASDALFAGCAWAQAYPSRPVRMLIGWAAGGPTDISGRLFASVMSTVLDQPVVVEGKPGASGQVAHEVLKNAAPDGYTIEIFTAPTVIGSLLVNKPVSPGEVAPVAMLYDAPGAVIVNPAAPLMSGVQTMKDLVAVARANPGKISYTSAGTGTAGHLTGAWIGLGEGLKWDHVGYKGVAPASVDLMAGRVQVAFGAASNDQQLWKDGKLRIISTTGRVRMTRFPGVPSLVESGYGQYSTSSWGGFAAPAGTPPAAIERLAAAVRTLFDRPDMVEKLAAQFPEPAFQPGEVVTRRMREDIENFSRIIREVGIKAE
jgi:tripartite-type tricarboxylate transporter receptor subunit TctC